MVLMHGVYLGSLVACRNRIAAVRVVHLPSPVNRRTIAVTVRLNIRSCGLSLVCPD